MKRKLLPGLLAPVLAVGFGCESARPVDDPATPAAREPAAQATSEDTDEPALPAAAAAPVTEWEPFAAWDSITPYRFEQRALASLPEGRSVRLTDAALSELSAALDADKDIALRAAVLLGRSGDPRAAEALLVRLQQRAPAPERADDAGDVVCAAALSRFDHGARRVDVARELARLAAGPQRHPDLEVRVECASSALALGDDSVVPFLFAVLYTHTPAARTELEDWPATRTVAWSKTRAAHALAERAGVPCTFQPDAAYADQVAEAERLEELVLDAVERAGE